MDARGAIGVGEIEVVIEWDQRWRSESSQILVQAGNP